MKELPSAPKFGILHVVLFIFFAILITFFGVKAGVYFYRSTHKQMSNQTHANPLQQLSETTKNVSGTAGKMSAIIKLAPTLMAEQQSTTPKVQIIPPAAQTTTSISGQKTASQIWLTYQNPTYHFSLNYPGNLQLKQTNEGLGVTSIELRSSQNLDESYSPDYQFLIFSKTVGDIIGQNFDTFYGMSNNSSETMKGMQSTSEEQFTKLDIRTISSLRALDYQTTASPPVPNQEPEVGTYIEIGDNVFITSTEARNKTTLDQILTSFTYPM